MRYIRSSHVDDAGRPRTSLRASLLTFLRFTIAVGMDETLAQPPSLASGSLGSVGLSGSTLRFENMVRHFLQVRLITWVTMTATTASIPTAITRRLGFFFLLFSMSIATTSPA